MEITVKSKYLHISPSKARPVLHGFRGLSADKALTIAMFTNRKAAGFLTDLIKSGIAVAKENYLEPDQVTIKEILCDGGPRLKRIIPWSKGQARRITKRMSHLALTLESFETPKASKKEAKKPAIEEVKEEQADKE